MTVRIEDITPDVARGMDDRELRNARSKAVQIYERTELGRSALRKNTVGVTQPIGRDTFMAAYGTIVEEMAGRGMEWRKTDLDAKLTRKAMRGVDVAELPAITLREGAVWLTGPFVQDPKRSPTVEVWLDSADYPRELEKRMVEALLAQTDRDVAVVDELAVPGIPAYDLVLVPRAETRDTEQVEEFAKRRMVDISKPFPHEHAARQLDPGQFQDFRRENNKLGSGIHAIWGILANGKVKLQSIRFSASKFTAAEAKAWLKDHDFKTAIEAAAKKSISGEFCKVDGEERVCAGIVYAPDEVDAQGDWTDTHEIWKAMKKYMIETGGAMKIMHEGRKVDAPVVEVFQAEADTVKGGTEIPAGAWYQANFIPEEMDDVWQAIKDGKIRGYSMAGRGEEEEEVSPA